MAQATYTKRALMTGAGSLFLQSMTTEDTPTSKPVYGDVVYETPSLQELNVELEVAEKKVHLSNLLHSDLSAVQSANITVNAAYLPEGFAEEHQGMIKLGSSWAMPTNPVKKPFRLAVPFTDENGDAFIINLPKCTLSPVNQQGQTQTDSVEEQIKQYNITAAPLAYRVMGANFVYFTMDMADTENKAKYDADKLLTNGWIDEETLTQSEKASAPAA